MKKLATLFSDSYLELKQVRSITMAAMFAAISVVLGYITIPIGDFIKIGFSSISNQFVYYLFGPVFGGVFGGAIDILNYFIKPTGAYFPGLTINAALGGVIFGVMMYKKPLKLGRILLADFIVLLICNVLLNTLWLSMLTGRAFLVMLPIRTAINLVMWPIESFLFYTIAKTLEVSGVFKSISGYCRLKRSEKEEKIKQKSDQVL